MTKKVNSITGQELREMFAAATAWLEKNAPDIDDLNVFPVPDGDTGTNMLLTMRSSVEEAYRAPDHSASGVALPLHRRAAAQGAAVERARATRRLAARWVRRLYGFVVRLGVSRG